MSRHQHHQGILVLKHVSDLQTNMGLPCCGCSCRCRASLRNQAEWCCYRERRDIHRSQQPDKPTSVFDYFYEQLYSDNKRTGAESNHRHPPSADYVSGETRPLCSGAGVPHVNLAQANSWNSGNERDRFEPYLESSAKKLVFQKECNFLIKSEHVDSRQVECGKCQRQLNNIPTALGIPLGYFEVYLAQETTLPEEEGEQRKEVLKETCSGVANIGSNVRGRARDAWKERGKSPDSIKKKHSSQRYGRSIPSRSPRNHIQVPEATTSFVSPKIEGCVVQTAHKTKEPVNHRTKLAFSRYRTESRSRSRSTYQSRSISRSRSTSRSRSSSSRSSRRYMRSSTVSSRSCRPSETEPHSRSRSPVDHNASRGPSRSTNQTAGSASRDRSARSPSIRRRTGSPCHLDKRRITSARRRPIAYRRAVSPSSSSSSGSSTGSSSSVLSSSAKSSTVLSSSAKSSSVLSSSAKSSSVLSSSAKSSSVLSSSAKSSSRISFSGSDSVFSRCSQPSVASIIYRSSTKSSSSLLHKWRGKSAQRSNYSRKNSHTHRKRLRRHLVPLMPSTLYAAKYSSA